MTLEEERQLILNCTARLRSIEGRAPAGWLSPWISESASTPDLLKEAGYAYTLNWCHDDQPTQINTRFGPLVSLPYPQEINDIPAVVARLAGSSEFADMIVDCFDEMLEQSQAQPLVMGIALHPYIVGQPHRLRHLRRALTQIVSRQQAWITHPGQIVQAAYPSEPGSLRQLSATVGQCDVQPIELYITRRGGGLSSGPFFRQNLTADRLRGAIT